jgi:hypothetical protein
VDAQAPQPHQSPRHIRHRGHGLNSPAADHLAWR